MSSRVQPCRAPAAAGHRGVLVWRWAAPMAALSSAPVGGGLGPVDWVLNIGVGSDYGRTDLAGHAGEVAAELGLDGAGAAMFTAVDLSRLVGAASDGVSVDATVGISRPTWAADPVAPPDGPDGPEARDRPDTRKGPEARDRPDGPGTINLVVQLPVALDPGAAVNAVMTATEAKVQALGDRGVPGTGTATDAVIVLWPDGGAAERFAGPRSRWGSRIGRAVYQAVWDGAGPRE